MDTVNMGVWRLDGLGGPKSALIKEKLGIPIESMRAGHRNFTQIRKRRCSMNTVHSVDVIAGSIQHREGGTI